MYLQLTLFVSRILVLCVHLQDLNLDLPLNRVSQSDQDFVKVSSEAVTDEIAVEIMQGMKRLLQKRNMTLETSPL